MLAWVLAVSHVCISVRHVQVLCQNSWTDTAHSFPLAYATLCFKEIKYIQFNISVFPSGTFPQSLDLEKFHNSTFTIAECHEQVTIINLLLKTPGNDGGYGPVLPMQIDWPLSPFGHTQCPALCTAPFAIEHCKVCQVDLSASADAINLIESSICTQWNMQWICVMTLWQLTEHSTADSSEDSAEQSERQRAIRLLRDSLTGAKVALTKSLTTSLGSEVPKELVSDVMGSRSLESVLERYSEQLSSRALLLFKQKLDEPRRASITKLWSYIQFPTFSTYIYYMLNVSALGNDYVTGCLVKMPVISLLFIEYALVLLHCWRPTIFLRASLQ